MTATRAIASERDSRILRAMARAVPIMDERLPKKRGSMSDTKKPPTCPKCLKPMTLAYLIPKTAGQPELKNFEYRACREWQWQTDQRARDGSIDFNDLIGKHGSHDM
jgi:hypothetical protein